MDTTFAFVLVLPIVAAALVLAIFYVGYAIVVRDD